MRYVFPLLLAATMLRAECIPFEKAREHVGKNVCIQGKVVSVNDGQSANTYLNFCADYKNCPFSAVVFPRDRKKLGDLKALEGKTVTLFGRVQEYRGHFEMVLSDKRQLEGETRSFAPAESDRHIPSAERELPQHRVKQQTYRYKAPKVSKPPRTTRTADNEER